MRIMFALAALACAAPAAAKDEEPCGKDHVCASDPTSIAAAMMRAGYQALIGKDNTGDPEIESAAAGYKFSVLFYGCEKAKACSSIQFVTSFKAEPIHTPAYANAWNKTKRFSQMSVDDEGRLFLRRDLSTVGGLTQKNFADELDWWTVMMGDLDAFFDEQAKAAKPAKGAGAKP